MIADNALMAEGARFLGSLFFVISLGSRIKSGKRCFNQERDGHKLGGILGLQGEGGSPFSRRG